MLASPPSSALTDLSSRGWAVVPGVRSVEDLLAVASKLGQPVQDRFNTVLRVLTPTVSEKARPGTLSARYGCGPFPLHTDTAFWPQPSRYLVMRVEGDHRRTTTLVSFQDLIDHLPGNSATDLRRSVWRVHKAQGGSYCSAYFSSRIGSGWRYDGECMVPANASAVRARPHVERVLQDISRTEHRWQSSQALVIDNWRVLHGRGSQPESEGPRYLSRIYVR